MYFTGILCFKWETKTWDSKLLAEDPEVVSHGMRIWSQVPHYHLLFSSDDICLRKVILGRDGLQ